jgi:hypothetical protein
MGPAAAIRAADLVFEPWDDLGVLHVVRQMRAIDAAEIFALRPDDDPFALYRDMAAIDGRHLWLELARPATSMQPVALFGAVATSPGCAQAHMIGTPALTTRHAAAIAARVRTRVLPFLRGAFRLHRGEALALDAHHWATRFLTACGATRREPRPRLGRNGEDFTAFVWLAEDLWPDPETDPLTDQPQPERT